MACPRIITGDDFLLRALAHIDCQAQIIGSYGYQALGQPGSTASTLVAGLLTLFIAFFGIRLLFGPPAGARDLVFNVLKIGIVLTLAFSWPAVRTVIYDVTLKGPAEIASVIQTSSANTNGDAFAERLQEADTDMVRLIELGTGRNSSQFIGEQRPGTNLAGTPLQDDSAFASARLLYLASVIGTLALLRVVAGLLLALTPIVAGLYFFTQSRGIFAGWLKGLVLTFAGSIGATIMWSVQLAVIEPWLADAINVRGLGYAIPSAPTEIFAIMLAFAIAQLVMIWFMAKIVFNRGWLTLPDFPEWRQTNNQMQPAVAGPVNQPAPQTIRAERISNSIENSIRREQNTSSNRIANTSTRQETTIQNRAEVTNEPPRLGNSYRRRAVRTSRAGRMRDSLS